MVKTRFIFNFRAKKYVYVRSTVAAQPSCRPYYSSAGHNQQVVHSPACRVTLIGSPWYSEMPPMTHPGQASRADYPKLWASGKPSTWLPLGVTLQAGGPQMSPKIHSSSTLFEKIHSKIHSTSTLFDFYHYKH